MSKRKLKYKNSLYYNPYSNTLIVSWFWSHRPKHIESWTKTDVLLATYGYLNMDLSIINQVLHNNDFEHPKFFHQLFKLLEDVRIFEHIRQQRPSTTKMIDLRIETRLSLQNLKLISTKLKLYILIYFFFI